MPSSGKVRLGSRSPGPDASVRIQIGGGANSLSNRRFGSSVSTLLTQFLFVHRWTGTGAGEHNHGLVATASAIAYARQTMSICNWPADAVISLLCLLR